MAIIAVPATRELREQLSIAVAAPVPGCCRRLEPVQRLVAAPWRAQRSSGAGTSARDTVTDTLSSLSAPPLKTPGVGGTSAWSRPTATRMCLSPQWTLFLRIESSPTRSRREARPIEMAYRGYFATSSRGIRWSAGSDYFVTPVPARYAEKINPALW
jgi:hypothetical protein